MILPAELVAAARKSARRSRFCFSVLKVYGLGRGRGRRIRV